MSTFKNPWEKNQWGAESSRWFNQEANKWSAENAQKKWEEYLPKEENKEIQKEKEDNDIYSLKKVNSLFSEAINTLILEDGITKGTFTKELNQYKGRGKYNHKNLKIQFVAKTFDESNLLGRTTILYKDTEGIWRDMNTYPIDSNKDYYGIIIRIYINRNIDNIYLIALVLIHELFIHASKFATVIASATNFSDALYKLSNESPDNHHSDVFELKSNYNKVCLTVLSTLKNASDINNKEFFSKGIEKVVFDSFANDQSLMVMRYINKSSYNRFYVYYKSYTDTHTFNSDFEHLPENVNNWFNNNEFHYLEFTRKQYEEATK